MNVSTVLKTPTNLLAGNERTGGRGGNRQAKMERKREMERVRMKSRKERRELMHGQRGGEWVRGGGGAIDGKMKEMETNNRTTSHLC